MIRCLSPLRRAALLLLTCFGATVHAQAVGTAFTYQGELREAGVPANADYDFRFRLFDAASGGSQVGPTVDANSVEVSNGLFAVPLDFGAGQFAGDAQWLEISVRVGAAGSYETLSPRTAVTPAPYALGAVAALANSVSSTSVIDGSIAGADIDSAQVQRRVSASCAAGQFLRAVNQDGSVTCAADGAGTGTVTSVASGTGLTGGPITGSGTLSVAPGGIGAVQINDTQVQRRVSGSCGAGQYIQSVAQDGTVTCGNDSAGWSLTGNAGTDPATNFIGTTGNQALSLRSNNQRVAQFSTITLGGPAGGFTANVLQGSPENIVATGVRGATISGGGNRTGDSEIGLSEENPNRVNDHYGAVGGGYANQAGDGAGTTSDRAFATVAGGKDNIASGLGSIIGGGSGNRASEYHATIAGGISNAGSGFNSAIGGGQLNKAAGTYGVIAGGATNEANLEGAAVGGGRDNITNGIYSTIPGGLNNATGGNGAIVAGGINNCAGGWYSFAAGWRAKVRPGTDPGGTGPCSGLTYPGGSGDIGTFVWAGFAGTDFISTGDEQFLVRAPGGIGFGTNAPVTAFDVVSDTENGHTAMIHNISTDSPSGLQIRLGVTAPTAVNNYITFERSDGANVGAIDGNGAGGIVYKTSGGDYAEYLRKADARAELPAGTVVAIRNGSVALDTREGDQLAVVSSAPAVSGNDPGDARRADYALVAFIGQADVRVVGPVAAGDFLVASGANDGLAIAVPAAAMDASAQARVVGRAWQDKRGDVEGKVRALILLDPARVAQAREIERLGADVAALREALVALRREIGARR